MKILCIGAGAIGICVGGSLAAVGAEIVYLERPEQKKELLGKTLTIINRSVVHHVSRFEIITEYRELEEVQIDCILIAVKAFDTDTVISQLKKSGLKFSSFLCLQNGIENEGKLHEVFPKADIIGASVVSAVSRLDLTSVRVEKNRGIGLCGSGEVFERIFGLLQKSGLRPMKFKDLAAMKWSKMISNLFANATSGILDMTPLEIYSRPGLFRIEKQQILEGLTVMRKSGIQLVNLPGLPLKLLVFLIKTLPDALLKPLLVRLVAKGRGEKMPSFYLEKMRGSGKSEVDFLNGAIVRKGQAIGVETPVNDSLVRVFAEILADAKVRAAYSRNAERLEKTINAAGTYML